MLRTALRRREDVWVSMKTSVLNILRRACVRIRWCRQADSIDYDLLGFSHCIAMRVLILLLGRKLLLHSATIRSGLASLLTMTQTRLLRRVLVFCFRWSHPEGCYFELLSYRIRQCCTKTTVLAPYTLLCAQGISIAGVDQREHVVEDLFTYPRMGIRSAIENVCLLDMFSRLSILSAYKMWCL